MQETMTSKPEQRYDRVRAHTAPEANRRIDEQTKRNLKLYAAADKSTISQRLEELDREWDIERTLAATASSIILGGLLLSLSNRKWLTLPLATGAFLMNHAAKGWCPPMTFFRSRGVRTRKEIELERFGLKVLRGDFDAFHSGEKPNIDQILNIINESKSSAFPQVPA